MTTTTMKPFRFVWRNANTERWFTTTVHSADPEGAIRAFQSHVSSTLKKNLTDVVVDHPFYSVVNQKVGHPYSLRDFKQPFHYVFNNEVVSPS